MREYSKPELCEALKSIESTLEKCQKAKLKLVPDTAAHTLLTRRIAAFEIAVTLIKREQT